MDLERLKQEWQNNEPFRRMVNESVIHDIIANKNKGALNTIRKNERQALRIIPVCVVLFLLFSAKFFIVGGFGLFWALLFVPIGAGLWYWSYYLCQYLDRIDMGRMSVIEASQYILKYKQYLVRHTIGSIILLPVYLGVWNYYYFLTLSEPPTPEQMRILLVAYVLVGLIAFAIGIWLRFFKHIREIQRNLKELNDFIQPER